MTVVQCNESSQRSTSFGPPITRESLPESEHDAPNETATMSSYGPRENPSIALDLTREAIDLSTEEQTDFVQHVQAQSQEISSPIPLQPILPIILQAEISEDAAEGMKRQRLQFGDFVTQLKLQQYFENRKVLLRKRKRVLQKTITLSARLHRVSSWVEDGLVEILEYSEPLCFARLHQYMQELINQSYLHWDNELIALDPLGRADIVNTQSIDNCDVWSKLSSSAQADFFDLLHNLRSNPRFLIERLKKLGNHQITAICNPPRFQRVKDGWESENGTSRHIREKLSRQRIQSYTRTLEDYATSFERSSPLCFLIFNMYGTDQMSIAAENQLRLSTWSTISVDLMLTSGPIHQKLLPPLIDCFASLYEWPARGGVEMFLMDVLQRGAFLLDQSSETSNNLHVWKPEPQTPQAQEFFNQAVHDLFEILLQYEGGFPTGALQFVSAMLNRLPHLDLQSRFRGIFFSEWFLDHFLCSAINYPENEKMLLNFHISIRARERILLPLWQTVFARVNNLYNEHFAIPAMDPFRVLVEKIIGKIDLAESPNPYDKSSGEFSPIEDRDSTSITISVAEVVQVLDALSPQAMRGVGPYDHLPVVLSSTASAFYEQYTHENGRFDRLKSELLESGVLMTNKLPNEEKWLQFDIDSTGRPTLSPTICPPVSPLQDIQTDNLDYAQKGALRLFSDQVSDSLVSNNTTYRSDFFKPPSLDPLFQDMMNKPSYRSDFLKSPSLDTLFQDMMANTSARSDPIGHMYWRKAMNTLYEKYPLSVLFVKDDSAVLSDMSEVSALALANCKECCAKLEQQLSVMEDTSAKIRATIDRCVDRFESLRLKMWYITDVVLSKHYDDAKNIARALSDMSHLIVRSVRSSNNSAYSSSRPMSSRSSTSSLFEQPYERTKRMLRAPAEHGGPRKLADDQIELTKLWLKQSHIENFCRGEERIHRFCMEVYTVAKNLVGETISESPVLWSSELFALEREAYDIRQITITSAPASTRPASIRSDTSLNYPLSRPILQSADSLRQALLQDRRSNGSRRIRADYLPPELVSSIGSPGRAYSATTAESISSVFSPLPSHARSFTTTSVYSRPMSANSRPGSILNEPTSGSNVLSMNGRRKAKFLAKVHRNLICLLLSDLGCPVWSLGSETDAMLDSSRNTTAIDNRLKQRIIAENLADDSITVDTRQNDTKTRQRSKSVSVQTGQVANPPSCIPDDFSVEDHDSDLTPSERRLQDLSLILKKLSQNVDPIEKLTIAEEFHKLSLLTLELKLSDVYSEDRCQEVVYDGPRRRSLDDLITRPVLQQGECDRSVKRTTTKDAHSFSEHKIIQHLKADLAKLRPKTLFRDLQYISAFAPPDYTGHSTRGNTILQLGLAALAYKDEVCRSMVDVADKLLSQTQDLHSRRLIMPRVTEYWMRAAREGNPVAQRELALLYLSQPEILPIMSLPLSTPSRVFQDDGAWLESIARKTNKQAMYLALHWMQQASTNGDRLATQKLEERTGGVSIR